MSDSRFLEKELLPGEEKRCCPLSGGFQSGPYYTVTNDTTWFFQTNKVLIWRKGPKVVLLSLQELLALSDATTGRPFSFAGPTELWGPPIVLLLMGFASDAIESIDALTAMTAGGADLLISSKRIGQQALSLAIALN